MAGTIAADTLTHSTAGSIATNYVVEGSAKAWVHFDGSSTVSIEDSLNTSSVDDNGTGYYDVNFSTSLDNGNYTLTGSAGATSTSTTGTSIRPAATFATGSVTFNIIYNAGSSYGVGDYAQTSIKIHGDLA